MYALLFIAAAAGKDIFFSEKKLFQIPALARVCMMVLVPTLILIIPEMTKIFLGMFMDCPEFLKPLIVDVDPATPMFPVWVFLHPVFMITGLIHQMRSLSMGPVTKTQPMMALSLVMYTLAAAVFGQGFGIFSVVGAIVALWGMVVCARPDGPKPQAPVSEPWQLSGTFDPNSLRVQSVVENTPPDVNPTFTSLKTLLQKKGLIPGLKAAFKEHWQKSGVFNAGFAALFMWIAMYFEGLSRRASDHKTFVFCDLIIMGWYLLMMVAVSDVSTKLKDAKGARMKKAIPGKKQKDPTLLGQLWVGGLLYGASFFFLMKSSETLPFSFTPIYMSLPIVALSAWGYFRRKERKLTRVRVLGLMAVVLGSVAMMWSM